MHTGERIGIFICATLAIVSWFYGVYAIERARRHHVHGRSFRWFELNKWGDFTALGHYWVRRSLMAMVVFVISIALAIALTNI